MSSDKKIVPLRKALHILGNRHHLLILVPGLIRQALARCLAQTGEPGALREQIDKIRGNLLNLESAGKEADQLLKDIKEVLYKKIDPDKTLIAITDSDIISGGKA